MKLNAAHHVQNNHTQNLSFKGRMTGLALRHALVNSFENPRDGFSLLNGQFKQRDSELLEFIDKNLHKQTIIDFFCEPLFKQDPKTGKRLYSGIAEHIIISNKKLQQSIILPNASLSQLQPENLKKHESRLVEQYTNESILNIKAQPKFTSLIRKALHTVKPFANSLEQTAKLSEFNQNYDGTRMITELRRNAQKAFRNSVEFSQIKALINRLHEEKILSKNTFIGAAFETTPTSRPPGGKAVDAFKIKQTLYMNNDTIKQKIALNETNISELTAEKLAEYEAEMIKKYIEKEVVLVNTKSYHTLMIQKNKKVFSQFQKDNQDIKDYYRLVDFRMDKKVRNEFTKQKRKAATFSTLKYATEEEIEARQNIFKTYKKKWGINR